MSTTSRSGGSCSARATASFPRLACTTSNPSSSKPRRRRRRRSPSSSMTSTRGSIIQVSRAPLTARAGSAPSGSRPMARLARPGTGDPRRERDRIEEARNPTESAGGRAADRRRASASRPASRASSQPSPAASSAPAIRTIPPRSRRRRQPPAASPRSRSSWRTRGGARPRALSTKIAVAAATSTIAKASSRWLMPVDPPW